MKDEKHPFIEWYGERAEACNGMWYYKYAEKKAAMYNAYEAGREYVLDLLREVSEQGIESNLKGIDYLTVQIDRELWNAIREEIEQ
jgi:hypothetical protein